MKEMTINIPVEEYKRLLEASIKIEVFSGFVNRSRFNIDREDCGRYLGFEVENKED